VRILGGCSPGQNVADQQGYADRHQATASRIKNMPVTAKEGAIKIATWNVRTLYKVGQLENLKQEMQTLDIDILGVCETRWTDNGRFNSDDITMLYSGGQNHANGVGIILKQNIAKSLIGCWAISDRVMTIKLRGVPVDINIIQAYAPTSASTENELETFYEQLDQAISICKSTEIKIVMGDFNAKIGEGRQSLSVGPYGLGIRNDRGDSLVEWCEGQQLAIMNTWFKDHKRRRYTWVSPDEQTKNQIDFMLIDHRHRNAIKFCKVYPGADCNSDHKLLMAKFACKMKRIKKAEKKSSLNVNLLRNDATLQSLYAVEVRNRFQVLESENQTSNKETTSEEDWCQLEHILLGAAEKVVPKKEKESQHKWMKDHILELMAKRRALRNKKSAEYKILNKKIQDECRKAKEDWITLQCTDLEDLEKKNIQLMYSKIKRMSKNKSRPANTALKDKNGKVVMEQQDILHRWTEYLGELFDDNAMPDVATEQELSGNNILEAEVKAALKDMKFGKAPGNDKITTELLTACEEISIKQLSSLANKIYESGVVPKQMRESVFIPLPKKGDLLMCGNYRLISLMSHITKIILRIIMRRIRNKLLPEISEEQFGFKKDCGTRNAIFLLRILGERSLEMQKDVHLAFIDYEKAFDRVKHDVLIEDLKSLGIDGKDLRLLNNLYKEQIAAVSIDGNLSDWIPVKRGVRQGCVLSPDLFSIYAENIMRKLIQTENFKVNGTSITNIRYADDTVLLADNTHDLQELITSLQQESEKRGLFINKKKTKIMVMSKKSEVPKSKIFLNGEILEQTDHFDYLGSIVTSDCRSEKEIRRRIVLAKKAFMEKKNIFADKKLSMDLKTRLLKCYVWSTLLYGCEGWTLSSSSEKKLEAAEMWLYRRMMRISWIKKVSNEKVLQMVKKERSLLRTIRKRQLKFVGHVIRKEGLEKLILEGKIEGKRQRGRQRLRYMDGLASAVGCSVVEVLRRAGDRIGFRKMIADVRL